MLEVVPLVWADWAANAAAVYSCVSLPQAERALPDGGKPVTRECVLCAGYLWPIVVFKHLYVCAAYADAARLLEPRQSPVRFDPHAAV
jgi:hypothetical protein